MRLSRYTSIVSDYPEVGHHLTFQWMTQAMAVLDDDVRYIVESPESFDADRLPPEIAQSLEQAGIIVPDGIDEREEMESWHQEVRSDREGFKATVLTTYDCNFACTYCVEEGIRQAVKLDGDMAARTVQWIIERLEEQQSKRLYLNFYGGEPLLNMTGIEQVAAPLFAYTQERGIEFDCSVTTNAALLTRCNAERLAAVGVSRAKVTLDGDRDAHDARRPFRNGRGSFDTIVRHLKQVWDIIEIQLAGNVDCQNIDAVPRLLDFLEAQGLADRISGIHFGGVSDPTREGCRRQEEEELLEIEAPAPPSNAADSEILEEIQAINLQVVHRDLPTRKAIGASLCFLNQADNVAVIDPLGKIYKCPALVGYPQFSVGDLSQGPICDDHLSMRPEELEDCMDCRWFAVCGGGCRFASFLEKGDIRRRRCTRDDFERYGDEMVKMDYEILLQEQEAVAA